MLGADGEADRVRVDPRVLQLRRRELRMCRARRVEHQRLHVRHVCQQREQLQRVDELERFLLSALDVERKDRRAAVREILPIWLSTSRTVLTRLRTPVKKASPRQTIQRQG